MIFLFYGVLIFFLLIYCRKKQSATGAIFSKTDTNILKGFSAMVVLFHHFGQGFSAEISGDIFNFNNLSGGVAVGIFFMLSAYGLFKSYQSNSSYYKKIFLVKIPLLYIYQVVINFIYFLIFAPGGSTLEILMRIFNFDIFFGFDRMNGYSWFITTILFMYILFGALMWLCELLKNKITRKRLFITIISVLLMFGWFYGTILTGVPALYHRSIFCFAFGVVLCLFEKEIMIFMQKSQHFLIITILSVAWLIFTFFIMQERDFAFAVCILISVLCTKFTFGDNKLFLFLGAISLEIYLLQLIFFNTLGTTEFVLRGLAVTGATIVSAYILNTFYNWARIGGNYLIGKIKNNIIKNTEKIKKNN